MLRLEVGKRYLFMIKLVFISLLLFGSIGVQAQSVQPDDMGNKAPKLLAKKGSYEVLIVDTLSSEMPIPMTEDILFQIEQNRDETDYVLWPVTPNIIIRIFPNIALIDEDDE
jgi:hypothetical protein